MTTDSNRTTWGVGEYPLMAECLEPIARELVELAGVGPDDHVLDLGCGTGNAALAAAARGARVIGVDNEPKLLNVARQRGGGQSGATQWVLSDFASAPVPAGAFSVVVSAFGVMYASDADLAAAAITHYCAPGARIALTAWTPGSFMPAMGAALAPYLPPPPSDASPPSRWGDRSAVADLLSRYALTTTHMQANSLALRFVDRSAAVSFLIRTAGHVLVEKPRLERDGSWDDLVETVMRVVTANDHAIDHTSELQLEYLTVVGRHIGSSAAR